MKFKGLGLEKANVYSFRDWSSGGAWPQAQAQAQAQEVPHRHII